MHRWEILTAIVGARLVPVIRAGSPEQAQRLVEAVALGGVTTVEVTMTVPDPLPILKAASRSGLLVGAGTVLDAETARLCILHGAQYLVTPGLFPEVIRMGHRYGKPVLVGAQSVTEVGRALEEGADIVKLFPGSHLGPGFLKALQGPLPQAPCMPTGGVSLENAAEWLAAGAVALGVGGELTGPGAHGDYQAVTELARRFLAIVRSA